MGRPGAKTVLVHRCKHTVDDYCEIECHCRLHITRKRAKEMVRDGMALWKRTRAGAEDRGHILVVERPKIPRAPTIDKGHIERAYVFGNKYERDRIEAYAGRGGNAS